MKLGLVGGIGPESTVLYYRKIISGVQSKLGHEYLPKISIESLSAFKVFELCRSNKFDELTEYLLEALNSLEKSGADFVALTGNTPNIVMDRVRQLASIPVLSAIDATCEEAKKRGVGSLGLLGTSFTMQHSFFKAPFENIGIRIATPKLEQIVWIQDKIENELEHGIVKEETRESLIQIIKNLQDNQRIDQVMLACTELPLILHDEISPVPCLDTLEIHVAALVERLVASKVD